MERHSSDLVAALPITYKTFEGVEVKFDMMRAIDFAEWAQNEYDRELNLRREGINAMSEGPDKARFLAALAYGSVDGTSKSLLTAIGRNWILGRCYARANPGSTTRYGDLLSVKDYLDLFTLIGVRSGFLDPKAPVVPDKETEETTTDSAPT